MPDEDSHLADHARSQAHDPGFRRDDRAGHFSDSPFRRNDE